MIPRSIHFDMDKPLASQTTQDIKEILRIGPTTMLRRNEPYLFSLVKLIDLPETPTDVTEKALDETVKYILSSHFTN